MCVVVDQLLRALPSTVGGVGKELVRASDPEMTGKTMEQKRCQSKRLANLVGFIIVVSNETSSGGGGAWLTADILLYRALAWLTTWSGLEPMLKPGLASVFSVNLI